MPFQFFDDDEVEQLGDSWKIVVGFERIPCYDDYSAYFKEDCATYTQVGVKLKHICVRTNDSNTARDYLFVSAIKQDTVNYKLTVKFTDLNPNVNNMNIPLGGGFLCISNDDAESYEKEKSKSRWNIVITKNTDRHPFAMLLDADKLYDFELSAKPEEVFGRSVRVHKLVLMASSPVFKLMLSGEWKETTQGYVELPTEMSTLKAFKYYMYTGQLPRDSEEIKKLLPYSNYYDMPQLKESCSFSIMANVTCENFREYLELAMVNNCDELVSQLLHTFKVGSLDTYKICLDERKCSPAVADSSDPA